jgi:drug/metabolite transporter (DMT)-like permease
MYGSPLWACLQLILATLLSAAVLLLVKAGISNDLPWAEVIFFRFGIGLLACSFRTMKDGFKAINKKLLVTRGVFGASSAFLNFSAMAHLPVAIATSLAYVYPIFIGLFGIITLTEPITGPTLGAFGLTASGVLLLLWDAASGTELVLGRWHVVALCSAVSLAISVMALARLRNNEDRDGWWEIFTCYCAFAVLGSLVMKAEPGWIWAMPTRFVLTCLVLAGILGILAQYFYSKALEVLKESSTGVLMQMNPVIVMIGGWYLFNERLSIVAVAGIGLSIAGVLLELRKQHQLKLDQQSQKAAHSRAAGLGTK